MRRARDDAQDARAGHLRAALGRDAAGEALDSEPASLERAVEELLRYLTVVQVGAFTRTAREDVELGGETIRTGEGAHGLPHGGQPRSGAVPRPGRGWTSGAAPAVISRSATGGTSAWGSTWPGSSCRPGWRGLLARFPGLRLAVPADEVRVRGGERFAPRRAGASGRVVGALFLAPDIAVASRGVEGHGPVKPRQPLRSDATGGTVPIPSRCDGRLHRASVTPAAEAF